MSRDQDPDLCRKLADKLIEMGWRATCDAQHDNLRDSIHELRQLLVPVQVDFMRAQFAGQAMQGICAHVDTWGLADERIVAKSYELADLMLHALAAKDRP